jgi:glycosyltransferase involved in cell wall biosynthesis
MARNAVVISHGSSSLLAVALATAASSTRWVYRNIGDPAAWVPTRWARMRTGWFMRRASAFAVLWPGAASSIQSLYRTGGTPMTVIPNDRDPQRFTAVSDEERRAAREALALEGNVVLFLGSLTAEKQPLTAVEAVSRIAGATLLVVGDGPLATEVRELGERLAPGRVRMLGVRGDPELAIAASDVLLLPSRTEGMPGVIIESMMRGVPVVATAVGAVLSMIDEGSTGCVVGVGDVEAMVRALQTVLTGDPARFRSVCRMRAVRDYSPQAVLDSWDELLGGLSAG